MKSRTGVFVLILLLTTLGLYSLLSGNGEEEREGEITSVPHIAVEVNETASGREAAEVLPPSSSNIKPDSTVRSTENNQVSSADGEESSDKFAQWFDDFEYSETHEGASAVVLLDWSLNGPPEPTPHSDILVELWANQEYDELNAFADERLRKDPTDKVDRLLKMELAALNGSVEEYYESCADVLESVKNSGTGHFGVMCAMLVKQIKQSLYAMEARSLDELEEARASIRSVIRNETVKGSTFPMRIEHYIKALEIDRYWGNEL